MAGERKGGRDARRWLGERGGGGGEGGGRREVVGGGGGGGGGLSAFLFEKCGSIQLCRPLSLSIPLSWKKAQMFLHSAVDSGRRVGIGMCGGGGRYCLSCNIYKSNLIFKNDYKNHFSVNFYKLWNSIANWQKMNLLDGLYNKDV